MPKYPFQKHLFQAHELEIDPIVECLEPPPKLEVQQPDEVPIKKYRRHKPIDEELGKVRKWTTVDEEKKKTLKFIENEIFE